jgi:hypothetical protein
MHEAKWTDVEGSTVTFKLPMDETAERQRNPFQKFTKRRKGRAGTRFAMVCYEVQNECQGPMVYKDEAMLAGWNDSQSNGHTVKFWLCADGMGHPFEGYQRKTEPFIVVLIELDDDNETIDQKMRDRVEKQGKRPSERLSYAAAMICKSPDFWEWLQSKNYPEVVDEDDAKEWFYNQLDIKSRAELDDPANDKAIEVFQAIRQDYLRAMEAC